MGVWRKAFWGLLAVILLLLFAYQLRLNDLAKTDSMTQLELRVDSLWKQLRRLEDVIAIQGYARNPLEDELAPSNGPQARRQRRLVRDFLWLKFLRQCEEKHAASSSSSSPLSFSFFHLLCY